MQIRRRISRWRIKSYVFHLQRIYGSASSLERKDLREAIQMSIRPDEIFELMHCSYRNGITDKFISIESEALAEAMVETGMNLQDLLNRMDDAGQETVDRLDMLLDRIGPFVKYLANDRLMRFNSRLLDVPLVKRWMVRHMKRSLLKAIRGKPLLRSSKGQRWPLRRNLRDQEV
jgi:hypothetical protein